MEFCAARRAHYLIENHSFISQTAVCGCFERWNYTQTCGAVLNNVTQVCLFWTKTVKPMNSRLLEENIYHFMLLELTVGIPTPETKS